MQESRLFKIIYYLLDKGSATAPELAERFEVSTRTIYRDINALSSAGIPVYAEAGRNGGIHLLDHFVLNKAVVSRAEKEKILSALQGLAVLNDGNEPDTLQKLSALFQIEAVSWLEVDFSRWGEKPRDNHKFDTIKKAIIQHRCLRIKYAASYKPVNDRVIQPLKLSYKSKDWYLKAFCTQKQDFRLFKLNRILEWELLDECFVPRIFPDIQNTGQPANDITTLLFPGAVSYRVYDEFDRNQIQLTENGDLLVTADMPQDDWLIGYLLSFGTQVEIIEPLHLKTALAEKAKAVYEKNTE